MFLVCTLYVELCHGESNKSGSVHKIYTNLWWSIYVFYCNILMSPIITMWYHFLRNYALYVRSYFEHISESTYTNRNSDKNSVNKRANETKTRWSNTRRVQFICNLFLYIFFKKYFLYDKNRFHLFRQPII